MNNTFFLAIQGSHSALDISLYNDSKLINNQTEDNFKASSKLIPIIKDLLNKNNLVLDDLSFIAIDQGPGAFTSLRVTIATVNGLAFAGKIPLIGIDGLESLSQQSSNNLDKNQSFDLLITLLNAYNNDVYFKINKISDNKLIDIQNDFEEKKYIKIDLLLNYLKENFTNKKIVFTGNGVNLHKDLILEKLQNSCNVSFLDITNSNSEQIAKMALDVWKKHLMLWKNDKDKINFKLQPLYLKSQNFTIQSKK